MEWIERLNSAVEYMEDHLLEKIDYEKVAEIANCPAYHFQRMFFYMTNISVSEYIRRRRMSLAAVDLQDAGAKVIDIALENGTLAKLYGIMNDKPEGLLGVSVHNEKEWKYFIAVSSTEDSDNFEQYNIPVATWAVFSGRGTNVSLQELERRVITEWLPTSGYEYAEIPDIEVYIKADLKDAIYEYWLPVVKKEDNSGSINN